MALCRFEAKIISRSGGRSAVGAASYRTGKCATSAAAYRAGAELKDERTGVVYDYTRKRGVMAAEIMLPEGAPDWMRDRGQLWNAVEKAEKRADAQLARDHVLTLPHELDPEQRRELTREFVREQFVDKGYVADIAWHAPHGKGDERNFHAHVMVVMRRCDANGFASKKERPPDGKHPAEHWKAELRTQREAWANAGADALDAAGFHLEAVRFRAGHLTLDKQREAAIVRGDHEWAERLDREAEPKQGPLATKIEQQGRESHAGNDRRAVQERNALRAELKVEHARVTAEIIDLEQAREQRARQIAQEEEARRAALTAPEPEPQEAGQGSPPSPELRRQEPEMIPAPTIPPPGLDRPAPDATSSDDELVVRQREANRLLLRHQAALEGRSDEPEGLRATAAVGGDIAAERGTGPRSAASEASVTVDGGAAPGGRAADHMRDPSGDAGGDIQQPAAVLTPGVDEAAGELVCDEQPAREDALLRRLQEQGQRFAAFKRAREQEAEEARKTEKDRRKADERRAATGDVVSAKDRYAQALARNYDTRDSYASLARAAVSEYGTFKRQQDELRQQAAAEKDTEKRAEIELRRRIEGHEYMAITSARLSEISEVLAGSKDAPHAIIDRERAQAHEHQAKTIREQRVSNQAEREQREKDSGMTETRAAKLARFAAMGRSMQQEQTRGRGGRSGGRE